MEGPLAALGRGLALGESAYAEAAQARTPYRYRRTTTVLRGRGRRGAVHCVLAHAVAQETRITDPASAAIGENALYKLMKAEYTDEGCEAAGWGPFPNATVATSTSLTAEAYARAHGTSGCKCGMLYGLAHSSLSHEDDVAAMSTSAQGPARCSGGSAAGSKLAREEPFLHSIVSLGMKIQLELLFNLVDRLP